MAEVESRMQASQKVQPPSSDVRTLPPPTSSTDTSQNKAVRFESQREKFTNQQK